MDEEYVRYYEQQGEDRNRMYGGGLGYKQRRRMEEIRSAVERVTGGETGTIVDVGCGDGWLAKHVLENVEYERYIGIDLSAEKLTAASKRLENAVVLKGNVEQLPLRAEVADLIICSEVLEHLFDPVASLDRMRSVLRDGGSIVLTTPVMSRLNTGLKQLKDRWTADDEEFSEHVQTFDPRAVKNVLQDAGFRISNVSYAVFLFPFFHRIFHSHVEYRYWAPIDRILSAIPMAKVGKDYLDIDMHLGSKYVCVTAAPDRA